MYKVTLPSLGLALLSSVTSVSAFWRMECRGTLGIGRVDPLANFGEVGSHVHTLFGGKDISFNSTPEDVAASSCTSCIVTEDKSNYWTPEMYFMGDDGSFTMVDTVGGMLAYYLLYGDNITAFPEGFQMISGDTNRRNFSLAVPDPPKSSWTGVDVTQPSLAEKAIGFNCLNYATTPEPSLYRHTMPNKTYVDSNCPDGLRLELMFPSCWAGEKDSPNHKDHVAFPDQVMTGNCPSDFPQRLPSLFYETIYNTAAFSGQSGSFVMANGDPVGTGYHGDFMMGWESESFLQNAVNTCTNPSGQVEDCPLFTLQTDDVASECTMDMPSVIAKENVKGAMKGLPGNVQVVYGPAPATDDDEGGSAGASSAVNTVSASSQTAVGYTSASTTMTDNYGGGVFAQVSATSSVSSAVSPTTTEAPAASPTTTDAPVASSADPAEKVMYTSIYTSAGQEVHLVMMEEDITTTVEATATETAAAHKRHVHQHRHMRNHQRF